MDNNRLLQLFNRFLLGEESSMEKSDLLDWYQKQSSGTSYSESEIDNLQKSSKKKILQAIQGKRKRGLVRNLSWMAAAAAIILTATFAYQFFQNRSVPATIDQLSQVSPAKETAIIELENGRKINLDELALNERLQIDDIIISKDEQGRISYHHSQDGSPVIQQNIIHVPRASTYSLVLADGTKIILNSESKLTYPSTFTNSDRIVELEGEAYFEVNHTSNNNRFIVKTAKQSIQVLGTKFNVKSYDSEKSTQTSLAEGSVNVENSTGKKLILKPGQQARTYSKDLSVSEVNMDNILSWKNGEFSFDGNNTEEVLREIARWYDIDIEYKKPLNHQGQYIGNIPRNLPLNRLVELLNYADLKSTATITNNQRIKLQIY